MATDKKRRANSLTGFLNQYKERQTAKQPSAKAISTKRNSSPTLTDFLTEYAERQGEGSAQNKTLTKLPPVQSTTQQPTQQPTQEPFQLRMAKQGWLSKHDQALSNLVYAAQQGKDIVEQNGSAIYEKRQAEKADAQGRYKSGLLGLIGIAATQAQRAQAGIYADPSTQLAEAQQQAEYAAEIRKASEDARTATEVIDWEGRDELVAEYKRLKRQGGNTPDPRIRRRMEEIRAQLEAGDKAAGNGERTYGAIDTAEHLVRGTGKNIGSALLNAGVTLGDITAKSQAYSYTTDEIIADWMLGQDSQKQMQAKIDTYNSEESRETWNKLYAAADNLSDSAAKDIQSIKNGTGALGSMAVDVAENVLEMGFDAGMGALTGGGSLVSMFVRTFGSSAQEARKAGATLEQQFGYGLTKATIEVATEKMFDGVAKIYGAGAADDITEELIRRLAETDTGRTFLRLFVGAAGEGTEEVVSDLLSPLAERIYNENVFENGYFGTLDPSEVLYDYLVGFTVGMLGSGGSIATGQNAQANAVLTMRDAGIGGYENQLSGAMDVLEGKVTPEQQQAKEQKARAKLESMQSEARAEQAQQQAENRLEVVSQILSRTAKAQGVELSDSDRATLAGIYNFDENGSSGSNYAQAVIEAFQMGKSGEYTAVKARMASKNGAKLTGEQFTQAFNLGAGVETESTGSSLEASLASLGTHAETAASAIEEGQDETTYSAAMSMAAGYAANGGNVEELAKASEKGSPITTLSEKQIQVAQEIGKQLQAERAAETKKNAEARAKINQQAEAILEQEIPELGEVNSSIKALTDFRAQDQAELEQVRQEMAAILEADPEAKSTEAYQKAQERAEILEKAIENDGKILDQLKESRQEIRSKAQRKKGTVSYDGTTIDGKHYEGIDRSKLTKAQQRVVSMVEGLADIINLDYVFFNAPGDFGGAYPGNGVVYININSGMGLRSFSKEIAAASLSHELTHFIQEYAAEEYDALRSFVVDEVMKKSPAEFDRLVRQQMRWEPGISYEGAVNELVANGCMTMLQNTQAVKQLVREHMTLAERMAERISEIGQQLKEAFGTVDVNDNAPIYQAAKLLQESFGEIQTRFDKALAAATENYNAEKTVERATGEKKNASREAGVQTQTFKGYDEETGRGIYESNFPANYPKSEKARHLVELVQNVFSKKPIQLVVNYTDGTSEVIEAKFDPDFDETGNRMTNLGKLAYGNKQGTRKEQRVTLDLADDYYQILQEARNYSNDANKENASELNKDVQIWHYFVNDILYKEQGKEDKTPYSIYIDVKKTPNGQFVYTFHAERNNNIGQTTPLRIAAEVNGTDNGAANDLPGIIVSQDSAKSKSQKQTWDNTIDTGESTIEVDTEDETANIQFSRWTWEQSDYVTEREEAAKTLAEKLGISKKKALDYIDSVNSVARMIADAKVRLDYEDTGRSPFVSNAEYGGSIDFTTLCKKRRLLTGTFTAIQKALANTALTANEILEIRKMMDDAGLEVSCGKCYVEGSRASMGLFTKEFINLYKKYNPGKWAPNMAEMNTPDGIEWVRQTHPEVYEQYEYFWNHYGTLKPGDPNLFASQQKPKLYQMRSAYKGEILQHFKSDSSIEEKNKNGGLRMQSFSDFEIVHLIDAMQVIMDMSRVGLAGQAYTKVPDFAWALGNTGLKINLSIDAWDVVDGKLVFNNKEGMNFETAMKLRDAYSKNVGTICCVYDDAQLLAALADPRIDFIIPFHRSQWKKSQYKGMGLPATTKDYTYQQNEKWLDPSKHTHEYRGRQVPTRCTNYMPNEYWDFSKSGKENAEEYLRMCARDGKRPKFYRFLTNNGDGSYSLKADGSTDGYWKLLIDFKMYDNEGVGSPQMPVRPDFNTEEVMRMLNSYEGGHNAFPVAQGIVDEFVKKYKAAHPGQTQFQRWSETADDTAAEAAGRDLANARLQAENAILTETVAAMQKLTSKQDKTIAALQKRLQITKTPEVRQSDARKLARTLIQEVGSKADAVSIAEQLKELGDYLLQTDTGKISEEEIKNRARGIASEILENASEQVGIEEDIARQIGQDIRGQKLSIDEDFLGELDVAGGYEAFRKSLFGRLTLAKRTANTMEGRDGYKTVTQFYDDLQSEYGKAYFPDVANEGEAVQVLAQMLDASQPMEVNPYEQYMGEVTEELANRIVMDAMNGVLRPTAPTTMDKQKARAKALQEQIKQLRDEQKLSQREAASLYHTIYDLSVALDKAESKYTSLQKGAERRITELQSQGKYRAAEIKAQERAKAAENIQALREHYQNMAKRASQGRKNTASRNKIRKLINDLNAKLAKPSENKYIPRELVQLTIDTLEMIDLDTGSSAKVAEKLADIRAMYERYKSDEKYAVTYDEVTAQMLSNLETQIRGTKLADMNDQQLNAVYETLKSLNHVISKAVNVKIGEEEHNAYELSHEMTQETREIPKAQTSWLKNKWLVSHLRADVMFNRFGGHKKNSTWSKIGRMLNDGQLKETGIKMELSRPFAKLINDRKGMEDFTGTNYFGKVQQDKLVDIGLKDENGDPILVSHDMMVGIYMDLLNEDNRRHFIRGGKTIPDLQEFYDGKGGFNGKERTAVGIAAQLSELTHDLAEAKRGQYGEWAEQLQDQINDLMAEGEKYADDVKASIEKNLTEFDKAWIKATQQLMDQDSKRYLNETTMDVYGIEKANVDNYFPITVDPDFLNASFDSVSKDMSLENVGFLKERVQSSKPTLAMGTFSVANKQIERVAQYCGLMPAIRNFQKILNKSEFGYQDSLKKALRSKFGTEAMKYLDGLIADLSGSRGVEKDTMGVSQLLGKLRGNLAQTTLTLNARVALAQAASYPTAAAELDAKSLAKAFFKGGKNGQMISRADQELIAKWSPLLWLRMQGYSTQELGDIKRNNSAQAKLWKKLRWATGWIQAVDGATVGRLWYATEYWVQDHMPNLQKGSDAYYEAVAKKFNDVVEKTQPNYTTMQRATILRDPSSLVKTFTMFMTQRLQNFNILYDSTAAYQKARADYANGRNDVSKADVAEAKATMVRSICSQLAQAAVYVGFKLLADGLLHNMKKYRDKETGDLTAESISAELLNSYIDAMMGATMFGSELYGIFKAALGKERWYGLSVSGVDSVNDLVEDIVALATTKDAAKRNAKILNVCKSLAQTLGIPLNNAIKIGQAIARHAEDAANGEFFSFNAGFEKSSSQEKMSTLTEAGIDLSLYRKIAGEGTVKQEDLGASLTAAIERGEITKEEADVIWNVQGWSPDHNFDWWKDQKVKAAEKEAQAAEKEAEAQATFEKYVASTGISSEQYGQIMAESDANGNNKVTQDELGQYLVEGIENGTITEEQAQGLWKSLWNKANSKTFDKWRAANGSVMPEATQAPVTDFDSFKSTVPVYSDKVEEAYHKWEENVQPLGIDLERYTDYLVQADTDGNGSVKQDEMGAVLKEAVDHGDLSMEQASAIWCTLWKGTGRSKSFEKWLASQEKG